MILPRQSVAWRCALFGLSIAVAHAVDAPTVLPKIVVTEPSRYALQEEGWHRAETSGVTFYSHNDELTIRLNDHLQRIREAIEVVEPQLVGVMRETHVTVVVCRGASSSEYDRWNGHRGGDALNAFATPLETVEGPVLLIDGDRETPASVLNVGITAAELTRAYALILMHRIPSMPRWVAEGLADVLKSTTAVDKRITVGRNEMLANVDDHVLVHLRTTASGADRDALTGINWNAAAAQRGGPNLPYVDQEYAPLLVHFGRTNGEALEMIDEIIAARQTGVVSSYAEYFINHGIATPLERLVDPNAEETQQWRMTAWAFVHLGLYTADKLLKTEFELFNRRLAEGGKPDATFREAFHREPGEFSVMLKRFSTSGRLLLNVFKLEVPIATPAKPVYQGSDDKEILPLKAAVFAATGRATEAISLLTFVHEHHETRTPASTVQLARLLADTDSAKALGLLEKDAATLTPEGNALLARLRLNDAAKVGPEK